MAKSSSTHKKHHGKKRQGTKPRRDVYQGVTDAILAALDAGNVPWRNPIAAGGHPKNLASGKAYRGINVFLLSMTAAAAGYTSPWWLTFKQALGRGGNVRKGQKGTRVVFWKLLEREETNDAGEAEAVKLPVLRFYTVFNAGQCDGVEVPAQPEVTHQHDPIPACDAIAQSYWERGGPTVHHGGLRAVYDYLTDEVRLPPSPSGSRAPSSTTARASTSWPTPPATRAGWPGGSPASRAGSTASPTAARSWSPSAPRRSSRPPPASARGRSPTRRPTSTAGAGRSGPTSGWWCSPRPKPSGRPT